MNDPIRPQPARVGPTTLPRRAPARRLDRPAIDADLPVVTTESEERPGHRRRRRRGLLAALAGASIAIGSAVGWLTRPTRDVIPVIRLDEAGVGVPTLTDGTTTYAAGRPGDVVVRGDFDGDGVATAVLLRPDTGDVFVFDRWPRPGDSVTARPITVPPGLASIEVRPGPEGDSLIGRRNDGTTTPLSLDPDLPTKEQP